MVRHLSPTTHTGMVLLGKLSYLVRMRPLFITLFRMVPMSLILPHGFFITSNGKVELGLRSSSAILSLARMGWPSTST